MDASARPLTERVVLHGIRVVPQSTDLPRLLEYRCPMSLNGEFVGRDKTRGTRADNGDMQRG